MEGQPGAQNRNELSLAQVQDVLREVFSSLNEEVALFKSQSEKRGEALCEQIRTIKGAFGPAKFNFLMLEEQEKAKIAKAERLKNPNKRKSKQVDIGNDGDDSGDDEDCRPLEPESMFVKSFDNGRELDSYSGLPRLSNLTSTHCKHS